MLDFSFVKKTKTFSITSCKILNETFQLENVRQENNQLKSEVSILRHRLHSKSIALHDLSCSLDEEKYKNSFSTVDRSDGKSTSFCAVYDEQVSHAEQASDEVFH